MQATNAHPQQNLTCIKKSAAGLHESTTVCKLLLQLSSVICLQTYTACVLNSCVHFHRGRETIVMPHLHDAFRGC